MKKYALCLIIGIRFTFLSFSQNNNEFSSKQQTWQVNAEPGICNGINGGECLLIKTAGKKEFEVFDFKIEGFEYEKGYSYTIVVKQQLKEPPIAIDESIFKYVLVKIISKKRENTNVENNSSVSSTSSIRTIEINYETIPCEADNSKNCLLIREKGKKEYEILNSTINGFEYQPGYSYVINVVEDKSGNYFLIKEISKKFVQSTSSKYNPIQNTSNPDESKPYKTTNGKIIQTTVIQSNSVLDKKWYLRKMKQNESESFITDENVIYIELNTFNDRCRGFGACNAFDALIKSDLKSSFSISEISSGFKNCGNKKIEDLFYEQLKKADRFEIKNGNLILSTQWKYLMEFTANPNLKEEITTTQKYEPSAVNSKESSTTILETKSTTTLDENKNPVTTTNTTITTNDEDEIQKQIDALEKKKAEKIAAQKKAEEEKIASDKEAELKKRDELKQQELAAAQAAEQAKLAEAKAAKDAEKAKKLKELERLQKELEEMDNGKTSSVTSSSAPTSSNTVKKESITNSKTVNVLNTANASEQIHNIFSAPEIPITFLGIDFSNAKYFGNLGIVTNTDLASMLKSINYIIPNEYDKYNIAKALKKEKVPLILQLTDNLNKNITDADFVSYNTGDKNITLLKEDEINKIVYKYDLSKYDKGIGLVFIVDNMDKNNDQATVWVTFIDINSNAVILTEKLSGKAGGFGFRSFWAHPFADIIGDIKSKQFKKWKEKYESGNSSEITPQKNSNQKIMKDDESIKKTDANAKEIKEKSDEEDVLKEDEKSNQKSKSGQKCSFEKNEKDKFTGKKTILSRSILFKEFTKRADIVFGLYEDTLFAVISYVESSPQVLEADKSSELWLILTNEKVLKLKISAPHLGH